MRPAIQRQRRGPAGLHAHLDFAAAARVVTTAHESGADIEAKTLQQRQEYITEIIERRCRLHVRTADNMKSAGVRCRQCYRQHRLQHECDRTGGANVETKVAASYRPGAKRKFLGA